MSQPLDTLIIGAGTAGLAALREVNPQASPLAILTRLVGRPQIGRAHV